MMLLTLATSILLSSAAVAVPLTGRQTFDSVEVQLNGAAGASYEMVLVTNSVPVPTNNSLSVSSVSMFGRASFLCTFFGIDGSVTRLVGDQVRHRPSRLSSTFVICMTAIIEPPN
jgi:hypothetical protein